MTTSYQHLINTPAQLRRQGGLGSIPMDTPTPASSNGHANSGTFHPGAITSTQHKPYSKQHYDHIVPTYKLDQPNINRVPLGLSNHQPLTTIQEQQQHYKHNAHLDSADIGADNSERARRSLEDQIRKGMGQLQQHPSSADSESDSLGYDGLSDAAPRLLKGLPRGQGLRAQIEDESSASESGTSTTTTSLGDDFSLRIGIAGTRGSTSRELGLNELERRQKDFDRAEQTADDLTYISVDQTVASPAVAPNAATRQSGPPAAVTKQGASLLGQEFERARGVLSQQQQVTDAPSAPVISKPAAVAALKAHANRLAPFPNRPSPSTKLRLPDVTGLTDGLTSPVKMRSGAGAGASIGQATQSKPVRGPSTKAGGKPAGPAAVSGGQEGQMLAGALDQLRNRLASLEQENAASHDRVRQLEARLQQERQRPAATNHAEQRPRVAMAFDEEAAQRLERKLREEEERRQALELLVDSLRTNVTRLTRSLEAHSTQLATLRAAPVPAAPSSVPARLQSEVAHVRAGLDELGNEVARVKRVVDELAHERDAQRQWDAEEKDRRESLLRNDRPTEPTRAGPGPATTRQERPRHHASGDSQDRHYVDADPDRTPRPRERTRQQQNAAPTQERRHDDRWEHNNDVPETPRSGRSFISAAEIERLQAELAREQARRGEIPDRHRRMTTAQDRQSRPPGRQQHEQQPKKSAAPGRPRSPRGRFDDEDDADIDGQDDDEVEEEPLQRDFRRAEQIFRSVTPHENDDVGRAVCSVCRRRRVDRDRHRGDDNKRRVPASAPPKLYHHDHGRESAIPQAEATRSRSRRPDPRRMLEDVLVELEADFDLHKNIYVELSEQYRHMNSKSAKRRALASHLKESIDTLEVKADQVRRLHDMLHDE